MEVSGNDDRPARSQEKGLGMTEREEAKRELDDERSVEILALRAGLEVERGRAAAFRETVRAMRARSARLDAVQVDGVPPASTQAVEKETNDRG